MPRVPELIAKTLRAYGTEVFFQVTGGDQGLWIALHDAGIRMILCRSEQGAAYMADGYARISGRPGFVYGQHGPGAANVVSGLPDPMWAMSPVVALASTVPARTRDRYAYQELDQLALYAPVTKWNKAVHRADRVGEMLRDAIRAAVAPPSGPVHLEMSRDLLAAEIDSLETYAEDDFARTGAMRAAPDPGRVRAVLELLSAGRRPLILAGSGVVVSEAWDELRALAELLRIPVATTIGGKGAIAEDHELALGVIGRYSRTVANAVAAEADAVLVVGSRLGSLSTNGYQAPSPAAAIAHVDVDPTVFGTAYRERVSVLADAKLALAALAEPARATSAPRHAAWTADVVRRVGEWKAEVRRSVDAARSRRPLHPSVVLDVLRARLGPRDLVVADTGYMAAWTGVLYETRAAGRVFIRAAGSLGWALPAALGASLAAPDRRVACVVGDGGVGYHLAEMETAARCRIPVLVLVMNNRALAFEYHEQRHHWGGRVIPEANDFSDADYAAAARALGAAGRRVESVEELDAALAEHLAVPAPTLLDVIVDKEAMAPVTNYDSVVSRKI